MHREESIAALLGFARSWSLAIACAADLLFPEVVLAWIIQRFLSFVTAILDRRTRDPTGNKL